MFCSFNFFVLSNEKQPSSYAQIIDLKLFNTLSKSDLHNEVVEFLMENQLKPSEIDVLIMGFNGDNQFDDFYVELQSDLFQDTQQVYYKHLCGEFNTASSFGFWLGSKILKIQSIPDIVKLNHSQKTNFKHVLLYNQYRGENHSFTLLRQC